MLRWRVQTMSLSFVVRGEQNQIACLCCSLFFFFPPTELLGNQSLTTPRKKMKWYRKGELATVFSVSKSWNVKIGHLLLGRASIQVHFLVTCIIRTSRWEITERKGKMGMALHSTSRNSVRRLWPEARRYIIRTYSFPLILCPQRISNFLISLLSLLFLVYLKGRTLSEESASGRTKHEINEIHKK